MASAGPSSSSHVRRSSTSMDEKKLRVRRNAKSCDFRSPERLELHTTSVVVNRNDLAVSAARNKIEVIRSKIWLCFGLRRGSSSGKVKLPVGAEFTYAIPRASTTSAAGNLLNIERNRVSLYSREGSVNTQNSTFTIKDIYRATSNFSSVLKIGEGGFGTVYKGKLVDGTYVAVKRSRKGIYDKHINAVFQSEIKMLAQVEHLNLVKLFGFLEHGEEKILVVEYVPNGTLREHLDCLHGKPLNFASRLEIAIDVAHAVTYLHMYTDHPIIHRDIKSSNVLLTDNLRAKVSDFGLARLGANETEVSHVSTEVRGTPGYIDPEYLRTFQLSDKSDVFSFGVLLVELVSGRRPIEQKREIVERVTPRWAMKKFAEGHSFQVLDPNLEATLPTHTASVKILELASCCLRTTKHDRPTMKKCAEALWRIRREYMELSSLHPTYLTSWRSSSVSLISTSTLDQEYL